MLLPQLSLGGPRVGRSPGSPPWRSRNAPPLKPVGDDPVLSFPLLFVSLSIIVVLVALGFTVTGPWFFRVAAYSRRPQIAEPCSPAHLRTAPPRHLVLRLDTHRQTPTGSI